MERWLTTVERFWCDTQVVPREQWHKYAGRNQGVQWHQIKAAPRQTKLQQTLEAKWAQWWAVLGNLIAD